MIKKILDYYVNPMLILSNNNTNYSIRNVFSDEILYSWKMKVKNEQETKEFLQKIGDFLRLPILLKNNDFNFMYSMLNTVRDNEFNNLDKETITFNILNGLHQNKIIKIDTSAVKKTIWDTGSKTNIIIVENFSKLQKYKMELIKEINPEMVILYDNKDRFSKRIGPSLTGNHIVFENMSRFSEPEVIFRKFSDPAIKRAGILEAEDTFKNIIIIEFLNNYLLSTSFLHNRQVTINSNGEVLISIQLAIK
ncbi:hypothetical protein [Leuconostoc citreum]|uniref:hypothetical protein n=1 Tax=Leuconostoc citreum TaxID=33964 RepID=UPI0032E04817